MVRAPSWRSWAVVLLASRGWQLLRASGTTEALRAQDASSLWGRLAAAAGGCSANGSDQVRLAPSAQEPAGMLSIRAQHCAGERAAPWSAQPARKVACQAPCRHQSSAACRRPWQRPERSTQLSLLHDTAGQMRTHAARCRRCLARAQHDASLTQLGSAPCRPDYRARASTGSPGYVVPPPRQGRAGRLHGCICARSAPAISHGDVQPLVRTPPGSPLSRGRIGGDLVQLSTALAGPSIDSLRAGSGCPAACMGFAGRLVPAGHPGSLCVWAQAVRCRAGKRGACRPDLEPAGASGPPWLATAPHQQRHGSRTLNCCRWDHSCPADLSQQPGTGGGCSECWCAIAIAIAGVCRPGSQLSCGGSAAAGQQPMHSAWLRNPPQVSLQSQSGRPGSSASVGAMQAVRLHADRQLRLERIDRPALRRRSIVVEARPSPRALP